MEKNTRAAGTAADAEPFRYRFQRGWGWALLSVAGAFALQEFAGMEEYVARWGGAVLKVASGAWIGYRVSKGTCRIDPGGAHDPTERGAQHLARALIIAGCVVGLCLSV